MNCPNCNGPMWDNRTNKKNPKAPDFKCKDPDCLDDKGNVTAVWLPKKAPVKANSAPNSATSAGVSNNGRSTEAMILAYAKDIVVAEIAKGEVKEPFKRTADGFKVLLNAYLHPFGQPKQEEPPIVEEPF